MKVVAIPVSHIRLKSRFAYSVSNVTVRMSSFEKNPRKGMIPESVKTSISIVWVIHGMCLLITPFAGMSFLWTFSITVIAGDRSEVIYMLDLAEFIARISNCCIRNLQCTRCSQLRIRNGYSLVRTTTYLTAALTTSTATVANSFEQSTSIV